MEEISRLPESEQSTSPRAKELFLMMHYVFWGTTMPPAAHDVLHRLLIHLHDRLKALSDKGEALDLDWAYADPETTNAIVPRLKWWIDEGKTVMSISCFKEQPEATS